MSCEKLTAANIIVLFLRQADNDAVLIQIQKRSFVRRCRRRQEEEEGNVNVAVV